MTVGAMRILLGAALGLMLAWGAPATAVVIASADGMGNTSAPEDDPGWGNVVKLGGLTGVYLGNGWVLTAQHVCARDMTSQGVVYAWVPGSDVQLETDGSAADLLLFQISRDPGLPDVLIRTSPPPPTAEVVMIGFGYNRGTPYTSPCFPYPSGWLWGTSKAMRWGSNLVDENGIEVLIAGRLTSSFSTVFDAGLPTPHEAQAAIGDSGGAVFARNEVTLEWELAGIMTAISTLGADCQTDRSALYGNHTYSADLSFYVDQIDAIASVPACDDGFDQDGDGLVDHPDDPGCADPLDPFETSDAAPCDDGIDNDGDGGIDFDPATYADPGSEITPPAGVGDLGCGDPTWSTESPECQDGINNDLGQDPDPGLVDYDGGQSIHGDCSDGTCPPGVSDPEADGVANPDPQCIGAPWRGAERKPNTCGLGAELALALPVLIWMRRRRR